MRLHLDVLEYNSASFSNGFHLGSEVPYLFLPTVDDENRVPLKQTKYVFLLSLSIVYICLQGIWLKNEGEYLQSLRLRFLHPSPQAFLSLHFLRFLAESYSERLLRV